MSLSDQSGGGLGEIHNLNGPLSSLAAFTLLGEDPKAGADVLPIMIWVADHRVGRQGEGF
jgi:hypothetical protein